MKTFVIVLFLVGFLNGDPLKPSVLFESFTTQPAITTLDECQAKMPQLHKVAGDAAEARGLKNINILSFCKQQEEDEGQPS